MKRLLALLIIAVELHAGMDDIFTEAQKDKISQAAVQCTKDHEDIDVDSARIMGMALTFAGDSADDVDIDTLESMLTEFSKFRKKLIEKCGHYKNGAIRNAFNKAKGNSDIAYELTGFIAGASLASSWGVE